MADGLVLKLSRILGEVGRETLPDAVVETAKSRIFHAFGLSLLGSAMPAANVAWEVARLNPGDCFAFGRSQRISAEGAALINGVIGHSSLLEDAGPGGLREGSHPGTFIVPAALAAAEAVGASGRLFLAGLVVGYEAVSRIGAAGPHAIVKRKFRPVGVMGPFGAAAAAATIFGANDKQLASALALAVQQSGGSTQGIFEGTMEPYFQAGFSAANGLTAARLAMAGIVTTVEALEGEFGFFQTYGGEAGNEALLLGPKDKLGITAVGTKQYAACLQNQQTLALIVDGLDKPVRPEDLSKIVIRRPEGGTNGLNSPGVSRSSPFNNALSAQMSARFTAAAALLGHPVDDARFYQSHFNDAEIVALADRIELVPAADDAVLVSLQFRNGLKIDLDADKSAMLFPSSAAIRSTFLQRADTLLGKRAEMAAKLIDEVEGLKSLRALTDALMPMAGKAKVTAVS